jgi:hypothetical protein
MTNSNNAPRTVTTMKMNSNSKRMGNSSSKQIVTSTPPDIGADLISSQTKSSTNSTMQAPRRGGTMLEAIKNKAAQLKSMLKLRSSTRKRR